MRAVVFAIAAVRITLPTLRRAVVVAMRTPITTPAAEVVVISWAAVMNVNVISAVFSFVNCHRPPAI